MDKRYVLILKSGEAEIKALQNTKDSVKDNFLPIVELTRGRKLPSKKDKPLPDEQYPFDNRLKAIKSIFLNRVIGLDITSDESLMNTQIDSLYNPENGYENWINFLIQLKEEGNFNKIIPCIVINGEDDNFNTNLVKQVNSLKKHFTTIIYRNNIIDENCYSDFILLKDELININLIVVIDSEYVVQAAQHVYAEKVSARVRNLRKILISTTKYIISSTSFPNNIRDIGNDDNDSFRLSEIDIYNTVLQSSNNSQDIIYSDYGSINPKRNDAIVMARGWIPRIDIPLSNEIYYYKQRRPKGISEYSDTYNIVAELAVKDKRFPNNLSANWGINQVINCSNGASPGSNPAFWISVRVCIHVEQQVNRIYSAY